MKEPKAYITITVLPRHEERDHWRERIESEKIVARYEDRRAVDLPEQPPPHRRKLWFHDIPDYRLMVLRWSEDPESLTADDIRETGGGKYGHPGLAEAILLRLRWCKKNGKDPMETRQIAS